jgi:hypothetical protein
MTHSVARLVRDRLDRLTDSLTPLRDRVRQAVAGEMAKAAAEALRDLLHAVLLRQSPTPLASPASPFAGSSPTTRNRWDEEDDVESGSWHDPAAWRPTASPAAVQATPSASSATAQALRTGVGLTTWLLHRRMPMLAGLGVGLLATLAMLSTHPLVQTGLAMAIAAAELVVMTESIPRP